jgi:hypothetical protein
MSKFWSGLFDEAWAAFKEGETAECDCDQALDAALRRELTEIARLYGVTEPDTLRVVLARPQCIYGRFSSMSASDIRADVGRVCR